VNHSLSLIALYCFPHLLSTNHKCARPFLPLFRGEHRRSSRACGSPSHHACGSRRWSCSSFSYRSCLDLRVHLSECNNGYCISLTLIRFVTAMVLHSFCLSCVCKLILAHTWDAFGFPSKIGYDTPPPSMAPWCLASTLSSSGTPWLLRGCKSMLDGMDSWAPNSAK
jgi:hypothetical protein